MDNTKRKCTESINVLRLTLFCTFFLVFEIFAYDTLASASYGHSPSAIAGDTQHRSFCSSNRFSRVLLGRVLRVSGFYFFLSLARSFAPLTKLQYASGVGFNKLAMSVAFTYHSLKPRSAAPIPLA